ncbi:MAG: hypothetical protein K2N38_12885 [Oscillospiraceae bacterium]|nr:hypothetical protein [Oscillospiraceae bacterium]
MDITAIIVAALSLIGTLGGSLGGILVSSKLTAYRIEQLEKRVEEHNQFARRMPLVEQRLDDIEQDVNELKQYHKGH